MLVFSKFVIVSFVFRHGLAALFFFARLRYFGVFDRFCVIFGKFFTNPKLNKTTFFKNKKARQNKVDGFDFGLRTRPSPFDSFFARRESFTVIAGVKQQRIDAVLNDAKSSGFLGVVA